MPTYRVEEANSARAGCKNKECADQKVKIQKGELRMGTWVESGQYQSWSWKHWGCVTPKQISSMQEVLGDDKDYNQLDGFEELSPEHQDKIRKAIEQGHIDDSDWKGDLEMNRPGKTGFRVRGTKKANAIGDDEKFGGGKKRKTAKSKSAVEPSNEGDEEKGSVPKKGKRTKAKHQPEPSDENEEPEPAVKKTKTTKGKKSTDEVENEDEPTKDKKSEKPTKGHKKTAKAVTENDTETAPDTENSAPKRAGRKKASQDNENDAEEQEPTAKPAPKRSGRKE